MKHKVSELEGAALDAAVAMASPDDYRRAFGEQDGEFSPSTAWRDGGPIIERERITVEPQSVAMHGERSAWWCAWFEPVGNQGSRFRQTGPTPLIAAMRAYVASKFGDEVELP